MLVPMEAIGATAAFADRLDRLPFHQLGQIARRGAANTQATLRDQGLATARQLHGGPGAERQDMAPLMCR